jgi:hypothetical protein
MSKLIPFRGKFIDPIQSCVACVLSREPAQLNQDRAPLADGSKITGEHLQKPATRWRRQRGC